MGLVYIWYLTISIKITCRCITYPLCILKVKAIKLSSLWTYINFRQSISWPTLFWISAAIVSRPPMRARECKLEEMRYQVNVGVADSDRIVGLSRAHIYWYRHDGALAYCVLDIVPKTAVCSRLACRTSSEWVSSVVHLPAYLLVPCTPHRSYCTGLLILLLSCRVLVVKSMITHQQMIAF